MAARRIPGVALMVIKDGTAIKTSSYGFANLELGVPVATNSVFEIGSVTKSFTAASLLLLQQDGKLAITDPISKHLPGSPPGWTNITLRHLLTHTSGIRSYTGLDGFELTKHLTQAQFIAAVGSQKPDFAPGDAFKHSNSGYSLLGYVVENVSGKSYWEFLRERILDPLGMSHTTDRDPRRVITNRVSGYEQTNRLHINRDYDLTDVFSAGAVVSTVGDLARWNEALNSERLLSKESKNLMWSPAILNSGKVTNYGFGWFLETTEGHRNVGHGGSTSGFSATLQRFPGDGLTVILLTNTDEMLATSLARRIGMLHIRGSSGQ